MEPHGYFIKALELKNLDSPDVLDSLLSINLDFQNIQNPKYLSWNRLFLLIFLMCGHDGRQDFLKGEKNEA